eukprot:9488823-Pyramimonas_sp.AAC.1
MDEDEYDDDVVGDDEKPLKRKHLFGDERRQTELACYHDYHDHDDDDGDDDDDEDGDDDDDDDENDDDDED